MISYYNGNETGEIPGILPAPYYWWEAGMFFDTLIQYWHLTGDSQYNNLVSQGIQFQQGPNGDFMPPNQTKSEGNDDQGVWALAAMSAVESQFPEPQSGTSWIALADAVFNEQVARWDTQTCGGGLRWQIFTFNTGYTYKYSLSNGEFFQLASRLARYTGNSTYSDWASKAFNWTATVGFIDEDWNVFDGASTTENCSSINRIQFSAFAGTYVSGVAHMYNISSADTTWKSALDGLLNRTLDVFFPDGVLSEIACESQNTCNMDTKAYKGILAHSLVDTIQMAPYTSQIILPKLTSSAKAAAKACNGDVCPEVWNGKASTNVTSGVGEQLSALSVVQGLLVKDAAVGESSANSTSTSTGSSTNPSSTTSGSAAPASTNSAVVVGAVAAKMGMLTAGLASMAWLLM
jgi:mannan endo-1,6-alpha-mannosidase